MSTTTTPRSDHEALIAELRELADAWDAPRTPPIVGTLTNAANLIGGQDLRIFAAREQLEDGEPAAALKTLTTVYAGAIPPTRLDRAILRATLAESRVKELEAVIERIRMARGNHPACKAHPRDSLAKCGWKMAVLEIDAALTDEKGE